MEKIVVNGGKKLQGTIKISGAKNAALPIMAACLLSQGEKTKILNVPIVSDVLTLAKILNKLGISVRFYEGSVLIDVSNLNGHTLPMTESKRMRASTLLAGPLLAKLGQVMITQPGGCVIGNRPIDMHLECFKAMGASVKKVNGQYFKIEATTLRGNKIRLRLPSVGATENLMMTSCLAKGKTIIENAAKEPEIVDLANFLISMGARIKGHGSSIIKIEGVKDLANTEYSIIPDRIETGTYIVATAITHGDILLKNTDLSLLSSVVSKLQEVGVEIEQNDDGVLINSRKTFCPTNVVTDVYPGFPTDMQSIITTLFSVANGESTVRETIFRERFNHVPELRKMGADIEICGDTLLIRGVKKLEGAQVKAHDLRCGASLLLAGLVAEGETVIGGIDQILRGYENPLMKLRNVGADLYQSNPVAD